MPDQLKLYGNDPVNGPDLYFYAHDTLGTFVAMDVVAPITDVVDESVLSDFLPMTVQAGQLNGERVEYRTLLQFGLDKMQYSVKHVNACNDNCKNQYD